MGFVECEVRRGVCDTGFVVKNGPEPWPWPLIIVDLFFQIRLIFQIHNRREGSLFVRCSEPQIQTKVQTRERAVVSLQPKNPTLSRSRDRNVLRFSVV